MPKSSNTSTARKRTKPHQKHDNALCKHCGVSFAQTRHDQRFCTPEHRLEHYRQERSVCFCPKCGVKHLTGVGK